jgi:NCS1 family nucleobase:cation symporter-1
MDQSEFTPPARKSLTDQEISQRLGAATADEAGMLAAMDFLEEQTQLRDEDNRATDAWLEKMHESTDPRAAIAIQNLDRAKRGLEPLPLVPPVPEYPVFNASPEPIVEVAVAPVVEEPQAPELGSAEEAAEEFEELLEVEPVTEPEPEPIQPEEPVAVSLEEIPAPVVRGFRLVSAANWILGVGILAPAVAAAFAALSGLNFVTSMLAGLVGVLVGVKVNVFGLVTARRTKRGLAVASRATFGVFGAILPGLVLLVVGLTNLSSISLASSKLLNNTVVGLPAFDETLFSIGTIEVKMEAVVAVVIVSVASVLAIFGGSFARWLKISLGGLLLLAFLAFAGLTVTGIDYLNLAGVFQADKFILVAPIFAVVMSVFSYGLDGESVAAASWGAKTKSLTWPIFIFGFLLPLLAYGHLAALLNGHSYKDASQVIEFLLSVGGTVAPTILVDSAILAIIAVIFIGVSKLIEVLKTLGTNHIGFGLATLVSVLFIVALSTEALLMPNALAINLSLTALLLIPAAAWVGMILTETLMRRGAYHDASLTRSYGFYGSVNWIAAIGFIISTAVGFAVAQPIGSMNWLGFLSTSTGISVRFDVAALLAVLVAVVYTLATGFPRVLRQQRETKQVEDRRFDLLDVVVD